MSKPTINILSLRPELSMISKLALENETEASNKRKSRLLPPLLRDFERGVCMFILPSTHLTFDMMFFLNKQYIYFHNFEHRKIGACRDARSPCVAPHVTMSINTVPRSDFRFSEDLPSGAAIYIYIWTNNLYIYEWWE